MQQFNLDIVPYFRLIVPFIVGIAASNYAGAVYPDFGKVLIVLTIGIILLAFIKYPYRYRWIFGVFYAALLTCFGAWYLQYRLESNEKNHFSKNTYPTSRLVGTVYDVPTFSKNGIKLPLHVEAVNNHLNDSFKICSGNILLYIKTDSDSIPFKYGDRLGVFTKITSTTGAKNPYAFDYGQYLHYQNINYQAFAPIDSIKILSRGNGNLVWRYAYLWRSNLLQILQVHFPTKNEYAVASALLVGYKEDLSDELRNAYAETGSMHALAVSGTHVSMLYAAVMFFLFRMPLYGRKGRVIEAIIASIIIWTFTFITGATASVLRAAIMFSIFLLGRATFQHASVWNILSNSVFLLLLINPLFLFDAGFQLSYTAVIGIVYLYPIFRKKSPVFRNWYVQQIWEALSIGVAAQIGTLPLTIYYFHQFPTYFWLSGWIVVFGGAVFMFGSFILIILEAISLDILASWVGFILFKLLQLINFIIIKIQALPGSVITGIWMEWWQCLLLFISLAVFSIAIGKKQVSVLWIKAGIILLIITMATNSIHKIKHSNENKIIIYNINNQKRLIDFFDGDKAISISDTIPVKEIKYAAQTNRWANRIRSINACYFKDSVYKFDNILYNYPFVQFHQYRIFILDENNKLTFNQQNTQSTQINVHMLMVSKSPKITPNDCLAWIRPELVVIDATNSKRKREEWIQECVKKNISYHDIRNQGYIIVNL